MPTFPKPDFRRWRLGDGEVPASADGVAAHGAALQEIDMRLALKADRRGAMGVQSLSRFAAEIAGSEDIDGYAIHLLSGETIQAEGMRRRKPIKLEPYAGSINPLQAWEEMCAYMRTLRASGMSGV